MFRRAFGLRGNRAAVSAYFEIETEPAQLQAVADALDNCDTVTQIYFVSGCCKLPVHAVAASSEELERFLQAFLYQLPGIAKLSCNIILSRKKDIKGLRL